MDIREPSTPHPDDPRRVIIEGVRPQIDCGRFPVKRVQGERLTVEADVFCDGHDHVVAVLRHRPDGEETWTEVPMRPLVNDRWQATVRLDRLGLHEYTVVGWIDHFATWQADLGKKVSAGQNVSTELKMGAELVREAIDRAKGTVAEDRLRQLLVTGLEHEDLEQAKAFALGEELTRLMAQVPNRSHASSYLRRVPVAVDPPWGLFSAWYEFFPRSCTDSGAAHGSFKDCLPRLQEIAGMGFDTVYLPPIHPIGRAHRKGRNNATVAAEDDPGSPWAIGGPEGGHKAIHPDLGSLQDFHDFIAAARSLGLRVALDLAYQCSPDHPYVKEHPDWFKWRPDGTIQYAENPPKKYQDVVPLDFETADWEALWDELKSVVLFWIDHGVTVFRVDNPHTKPFPFWEWMFREVRRQHPEVVFLAEAFTRPKVMQRLAKLGFNQSYTYFTWRNSKWELTEYLNELTTSEMREYFRPNFWPNTPDILPEFLQYGGRPAHIIRLLLAATLSSNYGVYGPVFELGVNTALPGKEEYLDSEKYEIKRWDRMSPESLRNLIARLNRIRRDNPALHTTWNLRFHETDNDHVLFYGKADEQGEDVLLVAVNLDPFHKQIANLRVPLEELGINPGQPYLMHDLLGDDKFIWQTEWNRLELDPHVLPARIFRVRTRLRREQDFDYFM